MLKIYYNVYCFYITKEPEHFHRFHIGVFDTKERAEDVVETMKDKPGFCEHKNKIKIRKIIGFRQPELLNKVFWKDGFETYTYQK